MRYFEGRSPSTKEGAPTPPELCPTTVHEKSSEQWFQGGPPPKAILSNPQNATMGPKTKLGVFPMASLAQNSNGYQVPSKKAT